MKEVFDIGSHFINGKPLYKPVRRILNLLFNVSISSFLFEKFYGKYTWFNISDYKAILDFFIKGQFFIPSSIFLVVYCVTQGASSLLFTLLTHFKSQKIEQSILSYEFKKRKIDKELKQVEKTLKQRGTKISKEQMIELYKSLRNDIKPEHFEEIKKELNEPKQNVEQNFVTAVRAIVAITVYFSVIESFGAKLYLFAFLSLFVVAVVMVVVYRWLEVLPTALGMLYVTAENYLKALEKSDAQ